MTMATETSTYEPGTHPDLAPPASTIGVQGWLLAIPRQAA